MILTPKQCKMLISVALICRPQLPLTVDFGHFFGVHLYYSDQGDTALVVEYYTISPTILCNS